MHDRADQPATAAADIRVGEFRQILLLPIELVGSSDADTRRRGSGRGGSWHEVAGGFTEDEAATLQQRYAEFIAFMPDAQRFLYGESGAGAEPPPVRMFRRRDVVGARIHTGDDSPLLVDVPRVELYFFYDTDLAILAIEISARDLSLRDAQDVLFRFGRAYPTGWDGQGQAAHCFDRIELLGVGGELLVASDYSDQARYLDFFHDYRAPRLAAHWAFLLDPMAQNHTDSDAPSHYRLFEHQRIPLLAYLALDDPFAIGRYDWMRLGHAAPPGKPGAAPFAPRFLADFERRLCYDRFWDAEGRHDQTATRILCSGDAFIMVGEAGNPRFTDEDAGVLALFHHQYFLLGLIAHFHRSALLIFRDRLFSSVHELRDYSPERLKRFRRSIRLTQEKFLRFTHRYWFQEVSSRAPSRDLFAMWVRHLGNDSLFAEVREEVQDMIEYLDSDGLRRQANTVVRLTIVTFFGLIGSTATGFLGMNIFDWTHLAPVMKLLYFLAVLLPISALTFYTAAKSQRLAELLDTVSDERRSARHKAAAFRRVWNRRR